MATGPDPWWRGARGEWYVAGQMVLVALVFFGPRHWAGGAAAAFLPWKVCLPVGAAFLVLGGSLFLTGVFRLGSNLTPLPHPRQHAALVESGPYRFVRHPIYSGGILASFGWGLLVQSWFTLGYAALLFVYLDLKARREERWLAERFPTYPEYRRRVRKFIPFLY